MIPRNARFWIGAAAVVVLAVVRRAEQGERVFLLRRLRGAAVRGAGDRLEHPRRLRRLRELRHRRLLRPRRLHGGGRDQCDRRAARGADPRRGGGERAARPRHRPADAAAARNLLFDRHGRDHFHRRDADHQLALRRRRDRHTAAASGGDRAVRYLHQDAVRRDGRARGDRGVDRALHRDFVDRPGIAGDPRHRRGRRVQRRAHAQAEAVCLHRVRAR